MKGSGRALELNVFFFLVVLLLVSLQLFLQITGELPSIHKRVQKNLKENGDSNDEVSVVAARTLQLGNNKSPAVVSPGEVKAQEFLAAPFVPNIRKSFTKRKAPYVRKAKKNKKKKEQRKKKEARKKLNQKKHELQFGPHRQGERGSLDLKKQVKPKTVIDKAKSQNDDVALKSKSSDIMNKSKDFKIDKNRTNFIGKQAKFKDTKLKKH